MYIYADEVLKDDDLQFEDLNPDDATDAEYPRYHTNPFVWYFEPKS